MTANLPSRIVCLTEETTETLYLLGEEHRIIGIWGAPTRPLAEAMIAGGLRAWIVCVDLARAPRAWAGRRFDDDFLKQVPDTVDPCGERGEFHTFAFAGPMFRAPLSTRIDAVTERDGFAYADGAGD